MQEQELGWLPQFDCPVLYVVTLTLVWCLSKEATGFLLKPVLLKAN